LVQLARYKQGNFGENRPSPIPVIDGDPQQDNPEPFVGTPVVLNSRNTRRELSDEIIRREDAATKPLVHLWNKQADTITAGDITRNGLTMETTEEIQESYQGYVDNELSPLWTTLAAVGGANIERGIVRKWPQTPGTVINPTLPGTSAQQWIQARSLDLVVDITESQAIAARSIVQRGLAEGLNERTVAARLKSVIGLTNREAMAVENLRSKLIEEGVNERLIERIVKRKANQLHTLRARRIARTEMTWGYNMGQLDAVKAYQEVGWIPRNVVIAKVWRKVLPVPECFCDSLDGQIVGLDSTYPGMTDKTPFTLTPPAHPNCACTIDIVVFEG
jgi:hypothetical protein